MYGCRLTLALSTIVGGGFACVAPPPASYETAEGVVRAATVEQAQDVHSSAIRLSKKIKRMLPTCLEDPLDIYVHPVNSFKKLDRNPRVGGFTQRIGIPGVWIMSNRIHMPDNFYELELAHELGHFLFPPEISNLPLWVQEGICEWLSLRLVESERSEVRRYSHADSLAHICGMELFMREGRNGRNWLTISMGRSKLTMRTVAEKELWKVHVDKALNYSLGWLLIESISANQPSGMLELEGLFRLCEQGKYDLDALWAEAGWNFTTGVEALEAVLSQETTTRFVSHHLPPIAKSLTRVLHDSNQTLDDVQMLSSILTMDLWVATSWGQQIDLRAIPEWESALRKALNLN